MAGDVPICFVMYKRPEVTRLAFAEISRLKPRRLFLVADGPRSKEDAHLCAATRAVVEQIDWDCVVTRDYSDVNLGARVRVSSGITRAFEEVDELIILEDDCIAHSSFFRYCSELLAHYRLDERVMSITGNNFQFGRKRGLHSYFFTVYPHCWGWATWKRAWRYFDMEMSEWPALQGTSWLADIFKSERIAGYWAERFDIAYFMRQDVWDYRWFYSCLRKGGLTASPNVNLVSNVGFGPDATHCRNPLDRANNLPRGEVVFPLSHPKDVARDVDAELHAFNSHFLPLPPSLPRRAVGRMWRMLAHAWRGSTRK